MKKYIIISFFIVSIFSVGWKTIGSEDKSEGGIRKNVRTAISERGIIGETLEFSGVIQGENETLLAFNAPGRINGIFKEEGDFVKKGDLLATIDTDILQAEKGVIEKQLEVAGGSSGKSDDYYDQLLDEAKSALEKAKANYDIAKDSGDNDEKKLSKRDLNQAEEVVSSAKKMRNLQREIAEGKVETYQSQIEIVNAQISDSRLIAPYDGIIISRNVDVGAVVSGSVPVFSLVRSERKEVHFSVPNSLYSEIEIGSALAVFSDAGNEFQGRIKAKIPQGSEVNFKAKVIVSLDNDGPNIGEFVDVKIALSGRNAVIIPAGAIKKEYHEDVVFVSRDGLAEKRFIEVGMIQGNRAEILQGIKEGENIIFEGQHYLKDNDQIYDWQQ